MAGSTYQLPTYPHWTGCIHTGPDLTNTDTGLFPVLSPSTHQHQEHKPRTTIAAIPVNTSVTSRPSRLATLFSLSVPFHRCFACHPSNLSLSSSPPWLCLERKPLFQPSSVRSYTFNHCPSHLPCFTTPAISRRHSELASIVVHLQSICITPAALLLPAALGRLSTIDPSPNRPTSLFFATHLPEYLPNDDTEPPITAIYHSFFLYDTSALP
ncbi:hypothetical protein CGRA01v4_07458 [Colletotrichum graminicola]|nr:hypothetical protein CGRA01v4_07458 [Colletotrichum graminicola]